MRHWRFFKLGNAICVQVKYESVVVVVAVSFPIEEMEIQGEEDANNSEKGHDEEKSGWSSQGWQTRSEWNHSCVSDGGQRSQDQWFPPNPSGKCKEVSNVVGDLGSLLKDQKKNMAKELQRKLEERARSSRSGCG